MSIHARRHHGMLFSANFGPIQAQRTLNCKNFWDRYLWLLPEVAVANLRKLTQDIRYLINRMLAHRL